MYYFVLMHCITTKPTNNSYRPRILYEATKLSLIDRVWKLPTYALRYVHVVTSYLVFKTFLFYACSYFVAHMFGRRLMYPGSLALIQAAMSKYIYIYQDSR